MQNVPYQYRSVCGIHANIRRIGQIWHLLDHDTCAILTNSLVLTRLDYNNVLLASLPKSTPLHLTQESNKNQECEHLGPVPYNLHWLLVHKTVQTIGSCVQGTSFRWPPVPPHHLQVHLGSFGQWILHSLSISQDVQNLLVNGHSWSQDQNCGTPFWIVWVVHQLCSHSRRIFKSYLFRLWYV